MKGEKMRKKMEKRFKDLELLTKKIHNLSSSIKEYYETNPKEMKVILLLYSLAEYIYNQIAVLDHIFIKNKSDSNKI